MNIVRDRVVADHYGFMTHNINKRKKKIKQNYKKGLLIYDDLKNTINQMAIKHPVLMSNIIDHKYENIKKMYLGGGSTNSKKIIDNIDNLRNKIETLKTINTASVKKNVNRLIDDLNKILRTLGDMPNKELILNEDTMLSNVDTLISSLKNVNINDGSSIIENTKCRYEISDGKTQSDYTVIKNIVTGKLKEYVSLISNNDIDISNILNSITDINDTEHTLPDIKYNEHTINSTEIQNNINIQLTNLNTLNNNMNEFIQTIRDFMGEHKNITIGPNAFKSDINQSDITKTLYNKIFRLDTDMSTMLDIKSELDIKDIQRDIMLLYDPLFNNGEHKHNRGGSATITTTLFLSEVNTYITLKNKWIKSMSKFDELYKKYNKLYIDMYIYYRYLILILTNKLLEKDYVIYRYINQGLILFYRRILEKLVNDFDSGNNNKQMFIHIQKHYKIVVKRLFSFMTFLNTQYEGKDIKSFIDIQDVSNNYTILRNDFILFNQFKNILEIYNESELNKITIYARINNNGNKPVEEIFTKEGDNLLVYDESMCKTEENAEEKKDKIKFTEVFDKTLPNPSDLSLYMTLSSSINKGKSTSIVTYGYSGTGKTYTLFGKVDSDDKTENVNGILQSTLAHINGITQIKIRVFELYGKGIPYTFYWKTDNGNHNISHNLFTYTLDPDVKGSKSVLIPKSHINKIEPNKFKAYIDDTSSYTTVSKSNMDYFHNFSETVHAIDKIRYDNKRIVPTPNNPESSRSVIIYDFEIQINNDKDVTFLIIDLPGRENIEATYITPYLNNPVIQELLEGNDTTLNELKMILTCMPLNPMGLASFAEDIIIKYIQENKKEMLEAPFFDTHKINKSGASLSKIINYNNEEFGVRGNIYGSIMGQAPDNNKLKQRKKIVALFLMSDLIEKRDFDTIGKIYTGILAKKINDHITKKVTGDVKADLIAKLINTGFKNIKKEQPQTVEALQNYIKYDYIDTPFEGIYINENIMGIVKYLTTQLVIEQDIDNILEEYKQDAKKLDKDTQRNIARTWIGSKSWFSTYFNVTKEQIEKEPVKERKTQLKKRNAYVEKKHAEKMELLYTSFGIDDEDKSQYKFLFDAEYNYEPTSIVEQQKLLNNNYKPEKIFNFENPIIENVLQKYIGVAGTGIDNFKFFYLFGNYNKDDPKTKLNCENQAKLLATTKNFITAITNDN